MKIWRTTAAIAAVALIATACGGDDNGDDAAAEDTATEETATEETTDEGGETASEMESEEMDSEGGDEELSGEVLTAGSSTVFPVAQVIQELYAQAQPNVEIGLDSIGSGGGFERFCEEGATDISNASRPIADDEVAACEENGINFIEVRIGTDALTMVTSPETEYLDCLSDDQIRQVFGPDAADTWDQVIDGAPADEIQVFSPGTDSGTFDFMVEDIMETEGVRQEYSDVGENDQATVQGVSEGVGTWGYFGLAFFVNNGGDLKAVAHENSESGECIEPSVETALAEDPGQAYELTRPLFIYIKEESIQNNPAVADYAEFFLADENLSTAIEEVGYVPAPDEILEESRQKIQEAQG